MSFEITFDYLCPFARNGNEAIVAGVHEGEPWEPTFRAFSLSQVHLEPDDAPVWAAEGEQASGVLALTWGLAARDSFPEYFLDAHLSSQSVISTPRASAGALHERFGARCPRFRVQGVCKSQDRLTRQYRG